MRAVFGDIDHELARNLMSSLDLDKDLDILLCSEGGSVGAALALYDFLVHFKKSTITATGICMSAATIVLQAAKVRRATKNTIFVPHFVSADGPFSEHATVVDKLIHRDVFNKRVGKENMVSLGSIFTAAEALSYNFIDEVV